MTNNAKHRESIKPTPSENLLFELADDLGTVAEPQAQLAAQAALAAARHVLGALNGRGGLPATEQPAFNTQHLAIIEQKSSLALTMARSARSITDRHEGLISKLQAADEQHGELAAQIARLDQQLATLQARQEKLRTLDQDLAAIRAQLAELPNLPALAEKAFSAWARAEKEAKTRERVTDLERTIAGRDRQKAILRRKHLGAARVAALTESFSPEELTILAAALADARRALISQPTIEIEQETQCNEYTRVAA